MTKHKTQKNHTKDLLSKEQVIERLNDAKVFIARGNSKPAHTKLFWAFMYSTSIYLKGGKRMKQMMSIDDCIKVANAQIDSNLSKGDAKGPEVILWTSITYYLRQHRAFLLELAKETKKEDDDASNRSENLS